MAPRNIKISAVPGIVYNSTAVFHTLVLIHTRYLAPPWK